jgi:hypothetical protein
MRNYLQRLAFFIRVLYEVRKHLTSKHTECVKRNIIGNRSSSILFIRSKLQCERK